jgi:hypothetical protein
LNAFSTFKSDFRCPRKGATRELQNCVEAETFEGVDKNLVENELSLLFSSVQIIFKAVLGFETSTLWHWIQSL